MTDVFNVLMVGVGGQGVVLTSDILTAAAMHAGLDAKKSEIHGMSQRGGPVFSHVRFGDKVHSPVIAKGEADILFGLERMELVRWAEWGRPGAAACYVNKDLPPHGVGRYPDELNERIRSIFGTVISFASQTLAAVPVVWAGMMLILVFAIWLGWFPTTGFPRQGWDDPWAAFRALILPALTIGIIEGAMLLRFVRSASLQAIGQDYVRTAAAKGLTRNQALIRHGLPNVGLSIVTVLGLQIAGLIVGSVIIEQLFTLPGIGRMLVTDVGNRDLIKVQGELLVLTGFILVIGFLVDLFHRVIDPRQRESA